MGEFNFEPPVFRKVETAAYLIVEGDLTVRSFIGECAANIPRNDFEALINKSFSNDLRDLDSFSASARTVLSFEVVTKKCLR
jgi:hypothetical protein